MFRLCAMPLEQLDLVGGLRDRRAGALATFEGWARNHNKGRSVRYLEYQACEALARKEAERVIQEALEQYELLAVHCVHRVGRVEIGQTAVWVGVTAAHRSEAFVACRYVIDQIKVRLPIWKKEFYVDGDCGWIHVPPNGARGSADMRPKG